MMKAEEDEGLYIRILDIGHTSRGSLAYIELGKPCCGKDWKARIHEKYNNV